MTVSSTTNRKTYTGDAATTSFATSPVVFFDTSDLLVYVVTTATGASTLLTENTHYTVTGGDGSTGTVNLAGGSSPYGAPSAAQSLVIVRELPFTQTVDPENNDPSDADVTEEVYDRAVMLLQQLNAEDTRTLRQPTGDIADIDELPAKATRASKYLAFDSDGDPVATAGTTSTYVVTSFMETVLDDTTAAAARSTMAINGEDWCGTAGGTADALTLTPSPAITAYASGNSFTFKAGSSGNTGAATVAVSGLTTKDIQKYGSALAAGDIVANKWYRVVYDGAAFQLSAVGGEATLAGTETLTNKTLTNPIVGTQTLGDNSTKAASTAYVDGSFVLNTSVATTSGAAVTVSNTVPSWVKRLTLLFSGVSTSGTSPVIVQLGTGGAATTSGYTGSAGGFLTGSAGSVTNPSDGFGITPDGAAGYTRYGSLTLTKATGNTWVASGCGGQEDSARLWWCGGNIALAGALNFIRITTQGGADTFDAGAVSLLWE